MNPSAGTLPPDAAAEVLEAIRDTADLSGVGLLVTLSGVGAESPEVVFANRGTAALLGYELDELFQIPIWNHFDAETLATLQEMQRRKRSGEVQAPRFEIAIVRKDGSRVPIEVSTTRMSLGSRSANVTFLYDVSARQKAAEALAASEARFRTVVESAPDGVAILRGRAIIYLNSAGAEMLGYGQASDAVGKLITDLIHPEDSGRATARIGKLFQDGTRHPAPAEYRSRRLDGSEISVEISSIPIDYEGAPAVLAFARNITERKAMHEKMVQADRLAAVGTLAAGIAHEINNPLAYVVLGLQYLERELPLLADNPGRLDDALTRLREVRGGAERVGNIVRDLKTFARADEVARGPVDLRTVMEAAIKIADNEIRHLSTLVRDYEDTVPVDGNAARLEQVFLNLLVNAAHAVSDGDASRNLIRVSVRRGSQDRVVAEVSDNGTGIPADILNRVFDPFFSTKPIGVGTGLGLPICRSIVEGFGGTMDLESTLGEGTTVRVELPVLAHAGGARSAEPARRSSRPPENRARVLVVDDEPLVVSLLRRILQAKHDVSVAMSGAEALQLLEGSPFDAIVCDVMMPEMTGMDLYALLNARDTDLAKRMIFMTGGAFVPRVAEFLGAVENPKLEKPFNLDALRLAIERVISEGEADPRLKGTTARRP